LNSSLWRHWKILDCESIPVIRGWSFTVHKQKGIIKGFIEADNKKQVPWVQSMQSLELDVGLM